MKSEVLFPPQLASLIMSSIEIGVVLGIVAGTKYYREGSFLQNKSVGISHCRGLFNF
jgi:hypothetical protein